MFKFYNNNLKSLETLISIKEPELNQLTKCYKICSHLTATTKSVMKTISDLLIATFSIGTTNWLMDIIMAKQFKLIMYFIAIREIEYERKKSLWFWGTYLQALCARWNKACGGVESKIRTFCWNARRNNLCGAADKSAWRFSVASHTNDELRISIAEGHEHYSPRVKAAISASGFSSAISTSQQFQHNICKV